MRAEERQAEIAALHAPVMLAETMALLCDAAHEVIGNNEQPQWFVDCTLGLGGHAERLLTLLPKVNLLAFDRDAEAMALARERLAPFGARVRMLHGDYRQLREHLQQQEIPAVAGILADFGISSWQLDTPARGFSFRHTSLVASPSSGYPDQLPASDERGVNEAIAVATQADAPLDMRMDRSGGTTAAHFVNTLSEAELADLIFTYGEELAARRIARRIVQERVKTPLETTAQLAALVVRAVQQKGYWRIHPATRTFQALRIAVNRELDGLEEFVADAVTALAPAGRLVILTFHSLEDRLIKQALRYQSGTCRCTQTPPERMSNWRTGNVLPLICQCGAIPRVEILTRKALVPSAAEIAQNPRARSAKLRACRKLELPQNNN